MEEEEEEEKNKKSFHGLSLLFMILSLISLFFIKINGVIVIMLFFLVIICLFFPKITPIAISFLCTGMFCDLMLNLYSKRISSEDNVNSIRKIRLHEYFNEVGTIPASLLGGFLTLWLCLPSYAIWINLIDNNNDYKKRKREKIWVLIIIGFVVGFVIGTFSEQSLALRPLLPFYKSTKGYLENRFWDGISVVIGMIPFFIFFSSFFLIK